MGGRGCGCVNWEITEMTVNSGKFVATVSGHPRGHKEFLGRIDVTPAVVNRIRSYKYDLVSLP